MACFNDLPNELLTMILNYVAAADIQNFAQINHRINSLAQQPLKKHRRLSRQYATVTISADNVRDTCDLLDHLLRTDHGHYIQVFVIDTYPSPYEGRWQCNRDMTSSALESLVHEVSTRKIFAQAVDEAEGSSVGARIWTHRKDILIALLLLHAPNVRCLRFLDSSCDFWCADPVWLQTILRQAVSGDPPTILENLSTVFSNASPHPLDHKQDLIRVPSVRRLELPSLYHWVSRNPESALCRLETFELIPRAQYHPWYFVSSQALHAFLTETKHLTTLNIQTKVFEDLQPPVLLTFADILSPVCSFLRILTILCPTKEHNDSMVRSPGSLAEFIALEFFEAHFDGIYPQYLPPSLQTIKLHGKACCVHRKTLGTKRYSARIFIEAVLNGHKSGKNPRLKDLQFTAKLAAGKKRSRELVEDLMRQCIPFGIQFKAPDVVDNAIARPTSTVPPRQRGQPLPLLMKDHHIKTEAPQLT
ncbi:MAG: hypothetical protein LQ339_004915 [Xanthoria mediterranea]|nr:MAG: hypothetical protein LQ339_004915 [Xanthoria mediterranea]